MFSARSCKARRIPRRGVSIVLVGIVLVALIAFVSLAVDIGRLRLVNAQLQTAADAGARAGAFSLPTHAAFPNASQDVINEAADAALANPVMNSASNGQRSDTGVVLDNAKDIHFGFWNVNNQSFTEIKDNASSAQDERRSANAVQVETWRTTARGTQVKLIFAPVIGLKNAYARATAYVTGGDGNNFGFVGLKSISSNGNKATVYGGVASDGSINLGNGDVDSTATVVGDARPGEVLPGVNPPALTQGPNSTVSGWMANLDYQLASLYPPILVAPAGCLPLPSSGLLNGGSDFARQVK